MSKKPHFIIYGVGAVGGMYGAQLESERKWQDLDYKVSFIARNQILEALKKNGLKFHVSNDDGSVKRFDSNPVNVVEKLLELEIAPDEYPVFLLCVKSRDTESCGQVIFDYVREKKIEEYLIISIQNGVENEDILAELHGQEHVMGAYTNVLAEVISPGEYLRKGDYWLCIGELEANKGLKLNGKKRTEFFKELFEKANLVVRTSDDIRADLWHKLVWNAGFNPTSVYYETDIRSLLDNPEAREKIINIMRETKELAIKRGIKIDPEIDLKHFKRTDAFNWQGFKTSMLQDYLRGRALELDQLLGVVVRFAEASNFPVPYSEALYNDLVKKVSDDVIARQS